MLDLTAVCERHGIVTVLHGEWSAVLHDTSNRAYVEYGPTKADAVCALLKARWGMAVIEDAIGYTAEMNHSDGYVWIEHRATELAAVVALADRLREVGG